MRKVRKSPKDAAPGTFFRADYALLLEAYILLCTELELRNDALEEDMTGSIGNSRTIALLEELISEGEEHLAAFDAKAKIPLPSAPDALRYAKTALLFLHHYESILSEDLDLGGFSPPSLQKPLGSRITRLVALAHGIPHDPLPILNGIIPKKA